MNWDSWLVPKNAFSTDVTIRELIKSYERRKSDSLSGALYRIKDAVTGETQHLSKSAEAVDENQSIFETNIEMFSNRKAAVESEAALVSGILSR